MHRTGLSSLPNRTHVAGLRFGVPPAGGTGNCAQLVRLSCRENTEVFPVFVLNAGTFSAFASHHGRKAMKPLPELSSRPIPADAACPFLKKFAFFQKNP